ncbi:MAG TPA: zinc ribbon domain-containing protein [Nitrospirae bacterium]|nr:zinc ribbon domain-containing protein [Nitrospirota bacterium]
MPVYEYECKSCKKVFEMMQKFDDQPLLTCESCGGEVRKLISNTSFVLKGTGWYITDYARKSEEKPATEKTSQDSKAETPETKSETTPPPSTTTETKTDVKNNSSEGAKSE